MELRPFLRGRNKIPLRLHVALTPSNAPNLISQCPQHQPAGLQPITPPKAPEDTQSFFRYIPQRTPVPGPFPQSSCPAMNHQANDTCTSRNAIEGPLSTQPPQNTPSNNPSKPSCASASASASLSYTSPNSPSLSPNPSASASLSYTPSPSSPRAFFPAAV